MNQILYTIEDSNIENNNKNIIKIFAVLVIIFGTVLLASGVYQFVRLMQEKQEQIEASKTPEITFSDEDNVVTIEVSYDKIITSIIYNWNDDEITTLTENKSENISEKIEVPSGTNTLYIKVIDEDGKTTNFSKEFTYKGTYMDVSVVDNKQLKVIVTDEVGLQSVTYKWNSEEEIIAVPEEDENTIEIITDIPTGLNTISITSINNNNEIQSKEKEVQGITKPTIKVNKVNSEFRIQLNDDQGIKSYSYKLYRADIKDIAKNGKLIENYKEKVTLVSEEEITVDSETEVLTTIDLEDGFNYLELTVKNVEGAEESISGWGVKK
jgi:hypothetical protein